MLKICKILDKPRNSGIIEKCTQKLYITMRLIVKKM